MEPSSHGTFHAIIYFTEVYCTSFKCLSIFWARTNTDIAVRRAVRQTPKT
jgi:hypothetical protein